MQRTTRIHLRHLLRALQRGGWATVLALLAMGMSGCESGTGPEARILTIEVASTRVSCQGEGLHECLQIREVDVDPAAPFVPTFAPIEGFTHEQGYRYVLRVAQRTVANPPADGSSIAYRLLRVVSRVRVEATE